MDQNIINREHNAILQTYKRLDIAVDHTSGCRIYDTDGNEYLDFLAGIAVNALGHSHPKIIEAVSNQIQRYMHVSNYFYQDVQIELAEKLKTMSGYDKVFFSNSGAESVEGALKMARRYGSDKNKTQVIAFTGGFHGRTYGALSLMDKPHYKAEMGPFLNETKVIEYNNIAELEKTVSDSTVAVILEFIQGEGGISVADPEFVEKLFMLRKKYSFLIIADEIQSGVGRSGKFFAFDHYDVKPDIVTCAKGIGGGLPLGAILTSADLSDIFEPGMHGTTYGGNPLACAAGKVVLDELEASVMDNVVETGNYFEKQLQLIAEKNPNHIKEVRGMGLMRGLLLNYDAADTVSELIKEKVLSNAASGTVLRMVPPLIITKADVDEFIHKLNICLKRKNIGRRK